MAGGHHTHYDKDHNMNYDKHHDKDHNMDYDEHHKNHKDDMITIMNMTKTTRELGSRFNRNRQRPHAIRRHRDIDRQETRGKSNLALPPPVSIRSSSINIVNEEDREGKSRGISSLHVPPPAIIQSPSFFVEDEDHQRSGKSTEDVINIVAPPKDLRPPSSSLEQLVQAHNDESNRGKKTLSVPPPVYVRSSPMSVKGEQSRTDDFWKRGRSVMHIDSDGIPVIHGVRMPDDESDRQTWRNARVINGVLVPYDKPSNQEDSGDKQEITRKATVHLEDPATKKKPTQESSPFQPSPHLEHTVKKKHHYSYPYASDTHARILEYINTVNQRESNRLSHGESRARMIRFPASRRSDKVQAETVSVATGRSSGDSESQGRVLHYPGSAIYPTSLLYTPPSAKTSRVSFEEGVRTPVLQYAHPELGVQPAKIMRKQDEIEEVDGVQRDTNKSDAGKANSLTLAYFAQDIHSDRSPYAYEPGMEANEEQTEAATTESSVYDKRSSSSGEELAESSSTYQWPKSSLAYLHEYQTSDDSYGLGNDKYIKRYPYNGYNTVYSGPSKDSHRYKTTIGGSGYSRFPYGNGHYSIHAHNSQERPFWERIGDTIREHVQTSMEKVTDITRPVVEPLVEATHKISHNLGFAGDGNRHVIQDKVGSAVSAYPVLLPALGLVAGGAALGLGAVAVGRYLDVDVMKRRIGLEEDDSSELEVEHKRALESIMKNLSERETPRQEGTWVVAEEFKNPEEQARVLETAVRALNERQQSGDQDEVQRKAIEEIVRSLRDRHNERQGQWAVTDNGVKQEDVKMIADVIRNINQKPKQAEEQGTWVLLRSVNPNENENTNTQQTVKRNAWSRSDGLLNQDEQERKSLESIVGALAQREAIGHRQGGWFVTEQSKDVNQQRSHGGWTANKESFASNERETKTKRSLDDGVIFVVEEDPTTQSREQLIMQESGPYREQRDINEEILTTIGQELAQGSLDSMNENDKFDSYQHRLVKRSEHESHENANVHQRLKRSTADERKTDDSARMDDGEQYLNNILHSLESGQQEIFASIARLDDHRKVDWSNTPCAKKVFCEVMVKQPADAVMLMEKKMATFLSLIETDGGLMREQQ
ncbi:hypothetical protein ANN_22184 [Periplaneta americana]|uniref:Uncharacterized protein n=1 Tax=Periplaneta americana TaxID=6978 RepID=A0ABQ8S7Z3_PERAM|nr:hypothetical protein ANN_22184 [Periplaneta americana]